MSLPILLLVLYGGLVCGWALGKATDRRFAAAVPRLQRVLLCTTETFIVAVAFWNLPLALGGALLVLPLAGLGLALVGMGFGWAWARARGLEGPRKGAMLATASLSNTGTLGVPICFALFGLDGQSFGQLYGLVLAPFVYLVIFQISARLGEGGAARPRFWRDPVRVIPLGGMALGLALSLAGVAIPAGVLRANMSVIRANLILYGLVLGYGIQLRRTRDHWPEVGAACAIKFALNPLVTLAAIALLRPLVREAPPLLWSTLLAQSFMPAAIFSVVTSHVHGLDVDQANACFAVTTLAALPVLLLAFTSFAAP